MIVTIQRAKKVHYEEGLLAIETDHLDIVISASEDSYSFAVDNFGIREYKVGPEGARYIFLRDIEKEQKEIDLANSGMER